MYAVCTLAAMLIVAGPAHALPIGHVRSDAELGEAPNRAGSEGASGNLQADIFVTGITDPSRPLGRAVETPAFVTAIPEPETGFLLGLGLAGLGVAGRRRDTPAG